MVRYECDACGKTLYLGEMFTATVKRVGAEPLRTYELCEECANKAKSVLAAFIMTKVVGE